MKLLQSFVIACSMYSRIPMPKAKWDEENMKYVMCFFPLIGGVIGLLIWGVGTLLFHLQVSALLFAAGMTLIPLAVTGGIHMDGFLDTIDALSSYGNREKKLEILKDPHAGAFAIIGAGCYFVWSMGVWSEVSIRMLPAIAGIFVLSRALSGLTVALFEPAKDSGLVYTFHSTAQRKTVKTAMIFYALLTVAGMCLNWPVMAGAVLIGAAGTFLLHYHICYHIFGGITGDLAGYFLQMNEIVMLTAIVLVSYIGI